MKKRAWSLFAWNIISAIVLFIAATILLAIIYAIAGLFAFGGKVDFLTKPLSITLTYAGLTFAAHMIAGGAFYGFIDYHNPAMDKPSKWSERMRTRAPLHYKQAQKECLPYIIVAQQNTETEGSSENCTFPEADNHWHKNNKYSEYSV